VIEGGEAQETNRRLRAKYLRPDVLDAVGNVWGELDDIAIEITPDRWRSWSASPFREATAVALDVPYEDAWLSDD
jgi:hypothetical protein